MKLRIAVRSATPLGWPRTRNAVHVVAMKLHTYAGNVHALQSLIVARYNGVEIELPPFEMGKDNKTKDFLFKSPMGKVPVLETAEGCICEVWAGSATGGSQPTRRACTWLNGGTCAQG